MPPDSEEDDQDVDVCAFGRVRACAPVHERAPGPLPPRARAHTHMCVRAVIRQPGSRAGGM